MKKKSTNVRAALLFSTLFSLTHAAFSQISGNVFRDINSDGSKSSPGTTPFEPGVYGITVNAYSTAGNLVGSTITNGAGDYSLPSVINFPIRLEFITAANEFSAKRVAASKSNVQFITAPTLFADFAVGYNTLYNTSSNPYVASNANSNGNSIASGSGEAGLRQNLFIAPYVFDYAWKTGTNYQNRWVGSVFGITFQRETRSLLMAAYLKRHAGFGSGGIDAIYKTTISTTGDASQPTLLLNLSTLGINVGTNPRTVALPNNPALPNIDPGVFGLIGKRGIGNIDLAENGKDLYVTNLFENKIHRIEIGLPIKTSFSATDLTGTWTINGPSVGGTEWHIMGVKYYNGLVYVGGVVSKQRSNAPASTKGDVNADQTHLKGYVYALNPNTGTITEVLQIPFNYRRGQMLDQYRYEFKNNWWRAWQNNADADVLRNDFNDALEVFPQPSAPYNTALNTGMIYPQPMLADIEFDVDGSMIVGIRDRFGDQGGMNNYLEGTNGTSPSAGGQLFRAFACGEILKAGKNGSVWALENNAAFKNNDIDISSNLLNAQGTPPAAGYSLSGSYATVSGSPFGWGSGVDEGYGPGGRYFYYNYAQTAAGVPLSNLQSGTFYSSLIHYMKSQGGVSVMAGYDEIVSTTLSPESRPFSSGLLRFSNQGLVAGTNAGNMTDQQEMVPGMSNPANTGNSDPSSFGKSNGMGDVEILSDAMPIEIGNRIWSDINANGVQDPHEFGISGAVVVLRSPGVDGVFGNADDQTWSTFSNAQGEYYFDNSTVNDNRKTVLGFIGLPTNSGILNGQSYRIEINPTQTPLTGLIASNANAGGASSDHIDSDGTLANLPGVGNRIYANVNTANNNYDFDFGFKSSLLPLSKFDLTASLAGNKVQLKWETIDEVNAFKFQVEKSVNDVNNFAAIAEVKAAVNTFGGRTYNLPDDVNASTNGTIYYRVRLIEKDGNVKFSNIATIKLATQSLAQIWPKPFQNKINVALQSLLAQDAVIELFDMSGKKVFSTKYSLAKGQNQFAINLQNDLALGMYQMKISAANDEVLLSEKLMKQ
jgi:trimeric autotransporter adhesin